MAHDLYDELAVILGPGAHGPMHVDPDETEQESTDSIDPPAKRRSGLGRGLSDLIPAEGPQSVPTHLQPESGQRPTVARVVIAETADAVLVELEDSTGARVSVPIGRGSIEAAVIEASLTLLGRGGSPSIEIEDLDTGDGQLVVVTVRRGEERSASAVFVEFGRPYAVARAVFLAVQDL
jgi:hypothetical protein